jgi:hypothetical protein
VAPCLTLGRSPSWCAADTRREIRKQIRELKAARKTGVQRIRVGDRDFEINIETYGNPRKGMCFDGCRYFLDSGLWFRRLYTSG